MSTEVERARGLDRDGIQTDRVRWNLSAAALYEAAVCRQEGVIAAEGPLACRTGQHTGRSANDKFVIKEPSSEKHVWWGKVNRPFEAEATTSSAVACSPTCAAARCSCRTCSSVPIPNIACRSG